MAQHNQRGKDGEDAACRYFKRKGYRIVARNVHSRFGEIDIIAEDGAYLCFVEVKTRAPDAIARPAEFVDSKKQQKLRLTAQLYLQEHPFALQPRFDVVEVIAEHSGRFRVRELRHIPNAF